MTLSAPGPMRQRLGGSLLLCAAIASGLAWTPSASAAPDSRKEAARKARLACATEAEVLARAPRQGPDDPSRTASERLRPCRSGECDWLQEHKARPTWPGRRFLDPEGKFPAPAGWLSLASVPLVDQQGRTRAWAGMLIDERRTLPPSVPCQDPERPGPLEEGERPPCGPNEQMQWLALPDGTGLVLIEGGSGWLYDCPFHDDARCRRWDGLLRLGEIRAQGDRLLEVCLPNWESAGLPLIHWLRCSTFLWPAGGDLRRPLIEATTAQWASVPAEREQVLTLGRFVVDGQPAPAGDGVVCHAPTLAAAQGAPPTRDNGPAGNVSPRFEGGWRWPYVEEARAPGTTPEASEALLSTTDSDEDLRDPDARRVLSPHAPAEFRCGARTPSPKAPCLAGQPPAFRWCTDAACAREAKVHPPPLLERPASGRPARDSSPDQREQLACLVILEEATLVGLVPTGSLAETVLADERSGQCACGVQLVARDVEFSLGVLGEILSYGSNEVGDRKALLRRLGRALHQVRTLRLPPLPGVRHALGPAPGSLLGVPDTAPFYDIARVETVGWLAPDVLLIGASERLFALHTSPPAVRELTPEEVPAALAPAAGLTADRSARLAPDGPFLPTEALRFVGATGRASERLVWESALLHPSRTGALSADALCPGLGAISILSDLGGTLSANAPATYWLPSPDSRHVALVNAGELLCVGRRGPEPGGD